MNWKAFWAMLAMLIGGLAAVMTFTLLIIWVIEAHGVHWVLGGGLAAGIVLTSAIYGSTDRDAP